MPCEVYSNPRRLSSHLLQEPQRGTGAYVAIKKNSDPSAAPAFDAEVSNNCLHNNQADFVWNPPGILGVICCVNGRGTNCDIVNNIFVNPLFCETADYRGVLLP
jgi:hypothetical protein